MREGPILYEAVRTAFRGNKMSAAYKSFKQKYNLPKALYKECDARRLHLLSLLRRAHVFELDDAARVPW